MARFVLDLKGAKANSEKGASDGSQQRDDSFGILNSFIECS